MTGSAAAIRVAIDADKVQAGPIALLFVVGLGVALVLLLRSLNKQLGRIDFERPDDPDAAGGSGKTRRAGGGKSGRRASGGATGGGSDGSPPEPPAGPTSEQS